MKIHRTLSVIAAALLTQSGTACASMHLGRKSPPPAQRTWPMALAVAKAFTLDSHFDSADSALADFATRNPSTPEALETVYWRALLKMDPSNPHAALPDAISWLDAYLADSRPREHVVEATTLRRIAHQLESLSRLAASAMTQAKDATQNAANAKAQVADANARAADVAKEVPQSAEAEIKKLKDELAKATAELERIRKRLSTPPGKP